MDLRILKQDERNSLIEKIIENIDPNYLEDNNKLYSIRKGNTNLSINIGYDKTMPSVFILEYFNEKRFIDNERKQIIKKEDMFYSNFKFPCNIFLDTGMFYQGSSQGLERIDKVIICKDFEKNKNNFVNLIKINDNANQINKYHRTKFDSIIGDYLFL